MQLWRHCHIAKISLKRTSAWHMLFRFLTEKSWLILSWCYHHLCISRTFCLQFLALLYFLTLSCARIYTEEWSSWVWQLAEQEKNTYVQLLMPLLSEFDLQPPVSDAQSMVSHVKVRCHLFLHLLLIYHLDGTVIESLESGYFLLLVGELYSLFAWFPVSGEFVWVLYKKITVTWGRNWQCKLIMSPEEIGQRKKL